jgi:hypothetical protein
MKSGTEVARVDVPDSGRFRIEIAPGSYDVSATFGNDLPCGEEQHVSVQQGRVAEVAFTCQMR